MNEQNYTSETLPICEMDIQAQISAAKQHPRDIDKVLANIRKYTMLDEETADECFYAVMKEGKIIEGVSVRLVEIIAFCWGNLRISTRIKANDGRTITAQATCHDLENNYGVSVETQRSILTSGGLTESGSFQLLAGNAASAIAYRNAVLKVIPPIIVQKVIAEIRNLVLSEDNLNSKLASSLNWLCNKGVSNDKILTYLNVKSTSDINKEKLLILRATINAINEGSVTVNELFKASIPELKARINSKAKSKRAIVNLP